MTKLNIEHAKNASLLGASSFNIWHRKFLAQWNSPDAESFKKLFWSSMPDFIKDYYKQNHSELYNRLDKRFGSGITGGI